MTDRPCHVTNGFCPDFRCILSDESSVTLKQSALQDLEEKFAELMTLGFLEHHDIDEEFTLLTVTGMRSKDLDNKVGLCNQIGIVAHNESNCM